MYSLIDVQHSLAVDIAVAQRCDGTGQAMPTFCQADLGGKLA